MLRPTLISLIVTALAVVPIATAEGRHKGLRVRGCPTCQVQAACQVITPMVTPTPRAVPVPVPVPSVGISPYDPAMVADAQASNAAMRRFGLQHHYAYAPYQKAVGYGSEAAIWAAWRASPAHARWLTGLAHYGYHYDGYYATLSGY